MMVGGGLTFVEKKSNGYCYECQNTRKHSGTYGIMCIIVLGVEWKRKKKSRGVCYEVSYCVRGQGHREFEEKMFGYQTSKKNGPG